jgi:basic membrane protein A and related proteins
MTIAYRKEVAIAMRIVFALAVTLSLVAGLSLSHPAQVFVPSWAQENKPLKVALVTDALFSDGGWGASAYNASQVLKDKYGLELTTQENIAIPDIEPTLRDAAEAGTDLILAHGFEWGDPALKVAQDYPNTRFVVFTGLTNSTNVASIFPMQQEGSFLLGALAGLMTKTNSLGCVGGKAYPNIINIFEGFKQGAKMVNPNVKITCVFIDDFQNPAKGKEAGLSLINNGADFLTHVADLSGQGVIQAADEKGVYALGVVADQNKLGPDTVLSSFVLDIEKAFDEAIRMVQNGNFSGQIYRPGLETGKGGPGPGIVYLASFHNLDSKVPADVKSKLAQMIQDVIDHKISVPERVEATT